MDKVTYIAVDFDGTIVTNQYPEVGELMPGALATLKEWKERGKTIIVWTCREDEYAEAAKAFLNKEGVPFDLFNENPPELIEKYGNDCRKLGADFFIDDKATFGGSVDWWEVRRLSRYCWS